RPGHRGEIDGIRGSVRQLPHPHSDPEPAAGIALQQIMAHHIADQPVGRGLRQFGTSGDLLGAQAMVILIEGCEHAHESIDHRIAGTVVRHAPILASPGGNSHSTEVWGLLVVRVTTLTRGAPEASVGGARRSATSRSITSMTTV